MTKTFPQKAVTDIGTAEKPARRAFLKTTGLSARCHGLFDSVIRIKSVKVRHQRARFVLRLICVHEGLAGRIQRESIYLDHPNFQHSLAWSLTTQK